MYRDVMIEEANIHDIRPKVEESDTVTVEEVYVGSKEFSETAAELKEKTMEKLEGVPVQKNPPPIPRKPSRPSKNAEENPGNESKLTKIKRRLMAIRFPGVANFPSVFGKGLLFMFCCRPCSR